MKNLTLLAAAAAIAFAADARADDPPAPPAKPDAPAAKPDAPPAAAKHENKITDEAKALFEKLAKTANGPVQKGMKETTGTITTETQRGPTTMKFTVKAPGVVHVEPPAGGGDKGGEKGGGPGGGKGRGPMGGRAADAENLLGYAFGIFRPSDESEFDAEVVKKDGKELLALTRWKGASQTERREITIGADGMIASAAVSGTRERPDGQKMEFKIDASYTWTKNGDSFRLEKIENKNERGSTTVEITYVESSGFSLPTSWKVTAMGNSMETKVGDLVVDGKKVEAPAKAEGAEPKKEGDGEKKDKKDEK